MKMKFKLSILTLLIGIIPLVAVVTYSYYRFQQSYIKEVVGGQMNFVDAKQQGVIRFLDQNEKMAKNLASLVGNVSNDILSEYFKHIVQEDIFSPKEHPFSSEIKSGKRNIPTFKVYHSLDFVLDGEIKISSEIEKIGKKWTKEIDLKYGYSDPYRIDGQLFLTFGQPVKTGGMLYVHVDANMLSNITNGEIGNLAGDMGAYYLAGVGKTMDYYIVNKTNKMITDSRVIPNAVLNQTGSIEPWEKTLKGHKEKDCINGKYLTNAGVNTGCREAMGFYQGASGVRLIGSSMPFYDSEWTIVVEQEADEIFAPLTRVRNEIIIFTLILSGVVIAAGLFFANGISKRVGIMTGSLMDIVGGNFSKRIDLRTGDELDNIAEGINSITNTLESVFAEVNRVMSLVQKGDLTQRVLVDRGGNLDGRVINVTIEMLSRILSDISAAANQVNIGANELSFSAQTLADGTSKQAGSLEEISSSMSEVETQTKANNENASQAKIHTDSMLEVVQKGNGQMRKMLNSMNEINNTSMNVSKIVKVIDEIAFQTNLLALNAAVEAARAGKFGKGFAVVAEEVRNLAARSAEAAKNTTELIERSVKEVENGVENAGKTADVLNEVNERVEKVNNFVSEIAVNTRKQSISINEINNGLSQVNSVVQQNSSISEQTASASDELTGQANQMLQLISQFKLSA